MIHFCRYHPHSHMRLVAADVPLFNHFATLVSSTMKREARMIYRCPILGCFWVESAESKSEVTISDRHRTPNLKQRYFTEIE